MEKNVKDRYAIVFGGKNVNSLGLIRSLGEKNVNVTFMSYSSKLESKYISHYKLLPENKEKWLDILKKHIDKLPKRPFVFPTDDECARFLDLNYESLKEVCWFSNIKGHIEKFSDKAQMSKIAKESDLSVADFEVIELSKKNITSILFPVIIKPLASYEGKKWDIQICKTAYDFKQQRESLIKKGYDKVLVQKFISGDNQYEVGVMGISLPNGDIEIPGIIKKIRSYPVEKGSTSFAKYIKYDPYVDISKIKNFVKKIGYTGIFDIELIISDKKAWFIEINFRNGQYGYITTKAGYNLPYNWIKGIEIGKLNDIYKINEIYYINERDDFRHVKEKRMSLRSWILDFKRCTAYGMFSKNDIRPFIRQYVKIPDRFLLKLKKFSKTLNQYFFKEEWNIAFRRKNEHLIFDEYGDTFIVLPNSIRYWAADPFIFTDCEVTYIFFEMYDRFKGKGLIGYRKLNDGKVSKMKIAYESDTHLSFPQIYKEKNDYFMLVENCEGKKSPVLKARSFPNKWEEVYNYMNDSRLVDSSFIKYKGQTYLFTQNLYDSYQFNLLEIYKLENGLLVPHEKNPIVNSYDTARLAGSLFYYQDKLIRVAQDCSEEYGKNISFFSVKELSKESYDEELLCRKTLDDFPIKQNKKNYCGVHTYNQDERYEVIDLKNKKAIKLGNIIYIILKLFKKRK